MQIRLYVPVSFVQGSVVSLQETQVHYLRNVLRAACGQDVFLFNGRDGEFSGKIISLDKKKGEVELVSMLRPQPLARDIRLYFAPLKRDCTDLVVEKASELGATVICPVMTEYTAVSRVNVERLQAIAVEASEQCRRLDVPVVQEPVALKSLLSSWTQENPVLFHLDESGCGKPAGEVLSSGVKKAAFLIGPEGGFSVSERELISRTPNVSGIDLGSRILRAETAAIAALALYSCR